MELLGHLSTLSILLPTKGHESRLPNQWAPLPVGLHVGKEQSPGQPGNATRFLDRSHLLYFNRKQNLSL